MFKFGDRVKNGDDECIFISHKEQSSASVCVIKHDLYKLVRIDQLEKVITPNDVIEAYEGSIYYGEETLLFCDKGWRIGWKPSLTSTKDTYKFLMQRQKPKENPLLKELEEESKKAMEHLNNINKKIEEIKGEENGK